MVIATIDLNNCMLDARMSYGYCNFDAISSKTYMALLPQGVA